MSSSKTQLVEQTLLIMVVGLCTALQRGRIDIVGAEHLLFSPRTMDLLGERGYGDSLVGLIHEGTELEDVESLAPDQLASVVSKLKEAALAKLAPLPPGDEDHRSWIVDCLEREPVGR